MNALIKKSDLQLKKMEPLLRKVFTEAEREHRELQQTFKQMGWDDLPAELLLEIRDDIKAFKEELDGYYSTCDPFVRNRRKSIRYWIRSYREGLCTLKTAVDALKVR